MSSLQQSQAGPEEVLAAISSLYQVQTEQQAQASRWLSAWVDDVRSWQTAIVLLEQRQLPAEVRLQTLSN